MTTPENAWAEAMKFENRADPYPFFDQLRETPVVQVADDTYVVTGYRELMALAHDPRISSDITRSPLGANRQPRLRRSPARKISRRTAGRRPSSCPTHPITIGRVAR